MANHVGGHRNKRRFLQGFSQHLFGQPFLLVLHSWIRGLIESIRAEGVSWLIQRRVNQHRLIGIHGTNVACLPSSIQHLVLRTIHCAFEAYVRGKYRRHKTCLRMVEVFHCWFFRLVQPLQAHHCRA